jgi:nitrite reductase/ring-hydroxylating ferredoxin subunit
MLVRNCWYVAAWGTEVTSPPIGRTLLGASVVLYRTASGAVAALENRCPHRGVPLSMGRVDGDVLRCGYHGLEFDTRGACVRLPGQDVVPRACRVRARTRGARPDGGGLLVVGPGGQSPRAGDLPATPSSPRPFPAPAGAGRDELFEPSSLEAFRI